MCVVEEKEEEEEGGGGVGVGGGSLLHMVLVAWVSARERNNWMNEWMCLLQFDCDRAKWPAVLVIDWVVAGWLSWMICREKQAEQNQ